MFVPSQGRVFEFGRFAAGKDFAPPVGRLAFGKPTAIAYDRRVERRNGAALRHEKRR
jgi:hypothetical protein